MKDLLLLLFANSLDYPDNSKRLFRPTCLLDFMNSPSYIFIKILENFRPTHLFRLHVYQEHQSMYLGGCTPNKTGLRGTLMLVIQNFMANEYSLKNSFRIASRIKTNNRELMGLVSRMKTNNREIQGPMKLQQFF